MTLEEFSLEFDVLYNNISSNKAPGLNEYEKSIFLTLAQEQIIKELYTNYEKNEASTVALSSLTEEITLTESKKGTLKNTQVFNLPKKIWLITLEYVSLQSEDKCIADKEIPVIPTSQDWYLKIKNNPFRGASDSRVLRLTKAGNSLDRNSVLVSTIPIKEYNIQYIRRPEPIILADLSDLGVTVQGKTSPQISELPETLHHGILLAAVQLAKATWA